ncbi:hypothetical protein [Kribbella ginsengisoli]|uniref:Uncharacterized protein n=1 Tax=Kribbella ginsengisoli TaxID=363865 RepID=A0ABP6VP24_9ACTN
MPYSVDPQVAGELGEGTVMDSSVHPPAVSRVEFVLDSPETDDLVQSFPVYLISDLLADRVGQAGLTGIRLAHAEVRPSEEFLAAFGEVPHRNYLWLQLENSEGADAWLDDSLELCVSDRLMRILEEGTLSDCIISEIKV